MYAQQLSRYSSINLGNPNWRVDTILLTTPVCVSCAAPKVWTGAVSSDWNNPANWSPAGVPGVNDVAVIPSAGVTNEPNISAVNVTIAGVQLASNRTLTISAGRTLNVTNAAVVNGTVNVTGTATASGTTDLNGSTFNFNGTSAQSLTALSYNNLTVNNAAGAALSGNTSVSGILALTNGILDNGANTLSVGNCAAAGVTGGSATSYVRGALLRCVNAGGTYNFPVGNGGYSPVALSGIVGANQNFTVAPTNTAPVATGLPPAVINRTWQLTNGGITSADVLFNYLDGDLPGGTTEATLAAYRIVAGAAQNVSGTVNAAANTLSVANVTSFSPWTLGGQLAPTGASVAVSGRVRAEGGRPVAKALVVITDPQGTPQKTYTDKFGEYRFAEVDAGQNYLIEVSHRRYRFNPRLIFVGAEMTGLDFTALAIE